MRIYEFAGAPKAVGQAHGETFRQRIHELARIRCELTLGRTDFGSNDVLVAIAERHIEPLKAASATLYEEFVGICEGAAISAADLVVLNHYTDLRDLSRAALSGDEGCSAVLIPGDPPVLGQTWDMHGSAAPFVEVLRLAVDGAPQALVFSLTGCLGMAGINEHGVAVTINNLNTVNAKIGVLWPALVRMLLGCRSAKAAKELLDRVGVGSGHHYQIADRDAFFGIEALAHEHRLIAYWRAGQENEQLTYRGAACHTNHCLDPDQARYERVATDSTTYIRWRALQELAGGDLTCSTDSLWDLLSDPRLSMALSASEPHRSATCGGLVFDWSGVRPAMRACRGPLSGQTGELFGF
jgi:isopenicillin-N N-acyltransferase-like protein